MKKPPPDQKSCATCAHFSRVNQADDVGYCKRYPPVPLIISDALACTYTVVSLTDTCGEFSRKLQS